MGSPTPLGFASKLIPRAAEHNIYRVGGALFESADRDGFKHTQVRASIVAHRAWMFREEDFGVQDEKEGTT